MRKRRRRRPSARARVRVRLPRASSTAFESPRNSLSRRPARAASRTRARAIDDARRDRRHRARRSERHAARASRALDLPRARGAPGVTDHARVMIGRRVRPRARRVRDSSRTSVVRPSRMPRVVVVLERPGRPGDDRGAHPRSTARDRHPGRAGDARATRARARGRLDVEAARRARGVACGDAR